MRVVLDENLPHALRNHLLGHEVMTAAYAGFAGLKNGALLKAASDGGFEVLGVPVGHRLAVDRAERRENLGRCGRDNAGERNRD
jgi:hypothetical protein